MTRALHALAALALALPAAAAIVHAQPTTVFLVHGLMSDGPAWDHGKALLQARLPNTLFLAPTLGSFSPFEVQAAKLREAMAPYGSPIAVGHSNGGTVLRAAARQGHPLLGAVVLGSPQQGAPLADRAADGSLVQSLFMWWEQIVLPMEVYSSFGFDYITDFTAMLGLRFQSYVNPWMNVLFQYLAMDYVSGLPTQTIAADMGVYGFANAVLNGNLDHEAAMIPKRFSIIYNYGGPGIMWKGLTPQWHGTLTTLQFVLYDVYMSNYESYFWWWDDNDPMMGWKRAYAYLWAAGAYALGTTDAMWCGLIDGWDENGYCASDGIVPVRNQVWPGSLVVARIEGLGHMEETSAPRSMDAVAAVLRQQFNAN